MLYEVITHRLGILEHAASVRAGTDLGLSPQGMHDFLRHLAGLLQPLGVDVMQGNMDVLQGRLLQQIPNDVAHEDGAAGTDEA